MPVYPARRGKVVSKQKTVSGQKQAFSVGVGVGVGFVGVGVRVTDGTQLTQLLNWGAPKSGPPGPPRSIKL